CTRRAYSTASAMDFW
nr:immunoglobulin heavy chain junction region [Mus musculus]